MEKGKQNLKYYPIAPSKFGNMSTLKQPFLFAQVRRISTTKKGTPVAITTGEEKARKEYHASSRPLVEPDGRRKSKATSKTRLLTSQE